MNYLKIIYRRFFPVKTNFESLKRLHVLKNLAIATLKFQNVKVPYVLERVENVEEYAKDWDRIEERYNYLADILTQEFLDVRVTMTAGEREIARECHRRVGQFYKMCQQYRDSKKQKEIATHIYEPRIINN